MISYELDVPLNKSGSVGGDARYGCCHQTEEHGHAESCGEANRIRYIEEALQRAGIAFKRMVDEDKQPGSAESVNQTMAELADVADGDPFAELGEVGGSVNHPQHYNEHPAGIECIDVIEHMTANVAAAVKYVWRAGLKPSADLDEDLRKAVWYIQRERQRVARTTT